MALSIVIPVFNEGSTIQKLVDAVRAVPLDKEIIIVDDGSTDGTPAALQFLEREYDNVQVIRHTENLGKGAALRTGFSHAKQDIVIVQDGDLEYDPREYPRLIQPILDGKADVVYGSRFIGGQSHRVLYFWHSMGNRLLTLLSNVFTNLNLSDMEGYISITFVLEPSATASPMTGHSGQTGSNSVRVHPVRLLPFLVLTMILDSGADGEI